MTIDLNREPDYSALISTLLDKTRAGKLRWIPTAIDDAFLATAKGASYEVRRLRAEHDFVMGEIESSPDEAWEREASRMATGVDPVRLIVKDAQGRVVMEFIDVDGHTQLHELWKATWRLVTRLDERIGELVTELAAL